MTHTFRRLQKEKKKKNQRRRKAQGGHHHITRPIHYTHTKPQRQRKTPHQTKSKRTLYCVFSSRLRTPQESCYERKGRLCLITTQIGQQADTHTQAHTLDRDQRQDEAQNRIQDSMSTESPATRETSASFPSEDITPLLNDEGAAVSFGTDETELIYCGRRLGQEAIPDSDGHCGPSNGPQCASCKRFQAGPRRADVLARLFPGIVSAMDGDANSGDSESPSPVGSASAVFSSALRRHGGILKDTISFLSQQGAARVDPSSLALRPADADRPAPVDQANVDQLVETLGLFQAEVATAALRRHPDVQQAAAWCLDEPDAVEAAVEEDRQAMERSLQAAETARQTRENAITAARTAPLPDAIRRMGQAQIIRPPQLTQTIANLNNTHNAPDQGEVSPPTAVIVNGHRMVHASSLSQDNDTTLHCPVCASSIPSREGGSFRCSECHLCEGCILPSNTSDFTTPTPPVVHRCPLLANGAHVHRHPLTYDQDRRFTCVCDVSGENCFGRQRGSVMWTCSECEFDVCASCMSHPCPTDFSRLSGARRRSSTPAAAGATAAGLFGNVYREGGRRVLGGGTTQEGSNNGNSDSFDELSAERGAAARWEGSYEESLADTEVLVGTGAVGTTLPSTSACLTRRAEDARVAANANTNGANGNTTAARGGRRGTRREASLLADTKLSEDAARALEAYRSASPKESSEPRTAVVAAADVAHVEDILHRANQVDDATTRRAICAAVAAGHLDIAGTLLLSHSYAPTLFRSSTSGNNGGASTAGGNGAAGGRGRQREFGVFVDYDEDYSDEEDDDEEEVAAPVLAAPAAPATAAAAGAAGNEGATTTTTTNANTNTNNNDDSESRCWCGSVIDVHTAPDGAVGCLGGHPMHASCAADLLLGGESCPTCRQPLFYPRVPETEAAAAIDYVESEVRRSRKEVEDRMRQEMNDLAERGLPLVLRTGDAVRIDTDKTKCESIQMSDPRSGGWNDDMADVCGKEGRIVEVIPANTDDAVNAAVSIKVRTKVPIDGLDHKLVSIFREESFHCERCGRLGPSSATGRRKCAACSTCEVCCRLPQYRLCPENVHEWTWNPQLLQLLYRAESAALWDDALLDRDAAAARAAERHMVRLRAELKTVSEAREAVQASSLIQFAPSPSKSPSAQQTELTKQLSRKSQLALEEMQEKKPVSVADWHRAHHLLLLAKEWGDGEDAKQKREGLYAELRRGSIDTVARMVRRHNAARTAAAATWADATSDTSEYIVDPTAKIDLRAYPSSHAPKTGYSLDPESRFCSRRELFDGTSVWLQIADETPEEYNGKVILDVTRQQVPQALIGAQVIRGKDWSWDNQDGGESVGRITQVKEATCEVTVKWGSNGSEYNYRAGGAKKKFDLVFVSAPPPPAQGWLCFRPGGGQSPTVVKRARSALRCFCCGDGLVQPKFGRDRFTTVKGKTVKPGDRLYVASTLEPVNVEYNKRGLIYCSFPKLKVVPVLGSKPPLNETMFDEPHQNNDTPSTSIVVMNMDNDSGTVAANAVTPTETRNDRSNRETTGPESATSAEWMDIDPGVIRYRPEDLVLPKAKWSTNGFNEEDEDGVMIDNCYRTRREVVLMNGGNEIAARKVWIEAKRAMSLRRGRPKSDGYDDEFGIDDDRIGFASCIRGHLMHARCFQGALLAGRGCPVKGCNEALWFPRVRYQRTGNEDDDDVCCGGGDDGQNREEAEALRTANELVGHAANVAAQASDTNTPTNREFVTAGLTKELKMCPACCSGPLFNDNCSDMQTHHGECSTVAIRGRSDGDGACTSGGVFRATASDIASRLMRMTSHQTVADVLPKCPRHDVIIMFNGCMSCGHLFTDTSWDELPRWDANAKTLLELDQKKRKAADLLAKQIRSEAAMLQYERIVLGDKKGPKRARSDEGSFFSPSEILMCQPCSSGDASVLSAMPSPPPPVDIYKIRGCPPTCERRHSGDGDCLVCGRGWGVHSNHTCRDGSRGRWPIR